MQSKKPRPLLQKTIGILGGMSNQATGEYYRLVNKKLNDRLGGWDNGEIVIVSVSIRDHIFV
jgi:aspartate racemase